MSSIIKRIVKKGKPKSVILPQGAVVQGQTNATNPTSLRKLVESYSEWDKAKSVPQESKPGEPQKRMPPLDMRYKDLGADLGICPYELRDILEGDFDPKDTLVFTLLKKFVAAVKLSGAVDFSDTHKKLKAAGEQYANSIQSWHDQCQAIDKRNNAVNAQIQLKRKEFTTAWSNILIDLQTKLERNADVYSLGEWDRLMVMAISYTGEEFCKIEKNKAKLDFKACQRMAPEKIVELPKAARDIQEHEEESRWHKWLDSASIDQLMKKLWEYGQDVDDEEARRREQIEWTIIAKSGKTPVRDRWGNLNWHATFRTEDDIDDYEFQTCDEEAHYNELMRQRLKDRMALGVTRVSSGSGKKSK